MPFYQNRRSSISDIGNRTVTQWVNVSNSFIWPNKPPNKHIMGPMLRDFCVKSLHLGGTSPYILHMWSPPPPALVVGAPKYFWFHQWDASWEFYNQTMKKKKCWKGAPFWKGNLSWNTKVKGHPASASSSRVKLWKKVLERGTFLKR